MSGFNEKYDFEPKLYSNTYQYTCDPSVYGRSVYQFGSNQWSVNLNEQSQVSKVVSIWESNQNNDDRYSTENKSFYGVVPSNTQSFSYWPLNGYFNVSRLSQTDVQQVIGNDSECVESNTVSLAQTIKPLISKIGTIYDNSGNNIGTCTLISKNLVMTARHAIEDQDVRDLNVTFGYIKLKSSYSNFGQTQLDYVIEDGGSHDYVIVKLNNSWKNNLGYVQLNTKDALLSEPALLHYPLEKPMKVSVHSFDQTNYETNYLKTFHDSDYCSSGGSYFDPLGRFTAMHLGAQLDGDQVNLSRYAITLRKIVKDNPNSLLAKFVNGKLSQAEPYGSSNPKYALKPSFHNFFIDEEGNESQRILTERIGTDDDNFVITKKGLISFKKKEDVDYIQETYPLSFNWLIPKCLGISDYHKTSYQYSVKGHIESDHTIPCNVWKSTTNKKMKEIFQQKGKYGLPAITIPYDIHRNLLTTGSSHEVKNFRKSLTSLCNKGKIDEALLKCFQEYENKGINLNLNKYKLAVIKSLNLYKELDLINEIKKQNILNNLY
jgi:hypothetical protein